MRRKTTAWWGSLVSIRCICLFWSSDSWKYEKDQLAKILTSLWLSIQIFLLWLCISMEGWRKWTGKEETTTKELLENLSVRPPFWMLHLRMRSPATSSTDVKMCWPSDSHVISWWSQVRKLRYLFGHTPSYVQMPNSPFAHRPGYLPPKILHNFCFSFLLGIVADVPREIENNAKFWG